MRPENEGYNYRSNAPAATGRDAVRKATASAFAIPGFKLEWQPGKNDGLRCLVVGFSGRCSSAD
jgi:hypothetical protein